MQISDQDFGWVIGILEGEGSFTARDRHRNVVSVYSTDEWTVRKLESLIGGFVTGPHKRRARGINMTHWKPIWRWGLTNWDSIYPLLHCIISELSPRRQEQAQKVLDNVPKRETGELMSVNTSGFSGVTLNRNTGRWTARVTANGRRYWIGTFATPELAASAISKWPGGA